jgi:hypothetical protein
MLVYFFSGFLLCLLAVGLYVWHQRTKPPKRTHIPKEWPLFSRTVVSRKELKVWTWLEKVMYDQRVMIKIPVTRFTIPAKHEEAEYWYNLLNRVYCTFTVCNADGRIMGCVDVPGPQGLSLSNQTLKYGLLAQCDIPYWVVEPDNLPHSSQIRTAFLGKLAAGRDPRDYMDSQFKSVSDHLQAAVLRQRNNKNNSAAVSAIDKAQANGEGPMTEGWEQNSFMTPLDSRAAKLRAEN